MLKHQNQFTIHAEKGKCGLNLYLNTSGKKNYLVTHRPNELLWTKLKDGITLGKLKRIKPRQTLESQRLYRTLRYLLKVVDDFLKYDLAA